MGKIMNGLPLKTNFTYKLACYVGLKGVGKQCKRFTTSAWNIFVFGLIFIAFLLLMSWQKQLFGTVSSQEHLVVSLVIWGYISLGTLILTLLVRTPTDFLKDNWLLPVAIILGLAFIPAYHIGHISWLRHLQPILAFCLLTPSVGLLINCFIDGKLSTTLWASLFIIVLFGFLIAGIDPKVHNVWDGIWWAIATVSTVGYGDVVPTSFLGRLLGTALIILGLGMFVTITANYLALLLQREKASAKEQGKNHPSDEPQILMIEKMESLSKELAQLSQQIKSIEKRTKDE
jgi:voltage-gated potassium channel